MLKFDYSYDNGGHSWEVMVNIHSDGHFTTTKCTEPDFARSLIETVKEVRAHEELLITVKDRIDVVVSELNTNNIIFLPDVHRERVAIALKKNTKKFIENEMENAVDTQLYASLLATCFIETIRKDREGAVEFEPTDDAPPVKQKQKLEDFLEDHAEIELGHPNYEFEEVWAYVYKILDQHSQTAVDLMSEMSRRFDT